MSSAREKCTVLSKINNIDITNKYVVLTNKCTEDIMVRYGLVPQAIHTTVRGVL